MADRIRRARPRPTRIEPMVAAAKTIIDSQRTSNTSLFSYASWQEEGWAFYENLGELNFAVTWLSQAMSRVRLTAAELMPGGDEPAPITEGPAAEAVEKLAAGIGGQAAIMKSATVQLSVPGEGWLVGETTPAGAELWRVRSTDEIQPSRKPGVKWEVLEEDDDWRPLPPDALPVRVWDPDPRRYYRATSAVRAALPILRRIDLLDRRIVSTLVSRLAMNGFLLIPQEGTFTVPEQYKDAADPFVQMLIDIASNNIKNPGSASAAIPMPIKFTGELIEKWRHLTVGDNITTELLDERDKELRRLATTVNVPAEIVLGMGDANHWTAWQLEESAIKLHIAPTAETICNALTIGFLHPLMAAARMPLVGPHGGQVVVWYDASELTARPDKSDQVTKAYDRFEATGEALRRESGLSESDKPDPVELREQILKRLAATVQLGLTALIELTGDGGVTVSPAAPTETPEAGAGTPSGPDGSPDGGGQTPPPPETEPAPATGPPEQEQPAPPPSDASRWTYQQLAEQLSQPIRADREPMAVGRAVNGSKPGHEHRTRDGPRRRR